MVHGTIYLLGTELDSRLCRRKEHFSFLSTMASSYTGGEQNVNRLISANASFTRQRDDARRTKQLAEERLNLVKKDSKKYSPGRIVIFSDR